MLVRKLLEEIERPLGDQPIAILGERRDVDDEGRSFLNERACAIRLCNVPAIAAGE